MQNVPAPRSPSHRADTSTPRLEVTSNPLITANYIYNREPSRHPKEDYLNPSRGSPSPSQRPFTSPNVVGVPLLMPDSPIKSHSISPRRLRSHRDLRVSAPLTPPPARVDGTFGHSMSLEGLSLTPPHNIIVPSNTASPRTTSLTPSTKVTSPRPNNKENERCPRDLTFDTSEVVSNIINRSYRLLENARSLQEDSDRVLDKVDRWRERVHGGKLGDHLKSVLSGYHEGVKRFLRPGSDCFNGGTPPLPHPLPSGNVSGTVFHAHQRASVNGLDSILQHADREPLNPSGFAFFPPVVALSNNANRPTQTSVNISETQSCGSVFDLLIRSPAAHSTMQDSISHGSAISHHHANLVRPSSSQAQTYAIDPNISHSLTGHHLPAPHRSSNSIDRINQAQIASETNHPIIGLPHGSATAITGPSLTGSRSLYSNVGKAQAMRRGPFIKAADTRREFSPYIDTMELEPYLTMNKIVACAGGDYSTIGSCDKSQRLAHYLLYRVSKKMALWYHSEAKRRICLLPNGSVAFSYLVKGPPVAKSMGASPAGASLGACGTVSRRFIVPLGGSSIMITADDASPSDENTLEFYKIGCDDIPLKHLTRYKYLQDSIGKVRCTIPRALVAYADSGLAAILGSSRFPGLYLELLIIPTKIFQKDRLNPPQSEGDAPNDGSGFWRSLEVPLDSTHIEQSARSSDSNRFMSLVQLWAIRFEAPESPPTEPEGKPGSRLYPNILPPRCDNEDGASEEDVFQEEASIVYGNAKLLQTPYPSSSRKARSGPPANIGQALSNSESSQQSSASESTSFSVTTPSPLFSGAAALYRRWRTAGNDSLDGSFNTVWGSTRHTAFSTPWPSSTRRRSDGSLRMRQNLVNVPKFVQLADFMSHYSLIDSPKNCDIVLVIKKSKPVSFNTPIANPPCGEAVELRINLLEVLRWNARGYSSWDEEDEDGYDDSYSSQAPLNKKTLPRYTLTPGSQDTTDEQVKWLTNDTKAIVWAIECACNLITSNLELLWTISHKDTINIDRYHQKVGEKATKDAVDASMTHAIYGNMFPTLCILDQP